MSKQSIRRASISPPVAEKRPVELTDHGIVRIDEYFWLRNRDDPDVIRYLEAENAYTAAVMADTVELQETIYREIRSRIKDDDESAPYYDNGYWYYVRYEKDDEYPLYARRRKTLDAPEEILLDVREMARGHEYTRVAGLDVSPDGRWLAYVVDTVGRRFYTLFVKDLATGTIHETGIAGIRPDPHWANDGRTLFYTAKHAETLRPFQIYRFHFDPDSAASEDPQLIYEESDDTFALGLERSKTRCYLLIISASTVSTEYRLIDADHPAQKPELFAPRRRHHEYYLDHDGREFFVLSNLDATNFRLMRASRPGVAIEEWKEVVPHRPESLIVNFELFRDYIALQENTHGLIDIRVIDRLSGDVRYVEFGEPVYKAFLQDNYSYESPLLRYGYESMHVPYSVYDFDMRDGNEQIVRHDEVLGDYRSGDYVSERHFATAPDGAEIPIALVYRKDTPRDGSAPLLQYGYGSYGQTTDAGFSYSRVSLLDRGFVFAIAQIRGGSYLGREWYDDGKLLQKKNTFTDFIVCSEYLIERGYAAPDAVYALGGSAGGLLVGAVMNMRPELYRGIIAAVPFVDVVTTMLDEEIPLTTGEYDEWGNPNERKYFEYMLTYSPYDNVRNVKYPHILITAGLHDSQVQYWEPAKWAARLRDRRQGDSLVLLYMNMDAGHGGASGRFRQLKEHALEWAFLLKLEAQRRSVSR